MQDLEARPQAARMLGEAEAVMLSRHDDVRQQQIDVLAVLQHPERGIAVARLDDLIPLPHQIGIEQPAHGGVVLYDQDASGHWHCSMSFREPRPR